MPPKRGRKSKKSAKVKEVEVEEVKEVEVKEVEVQDCKEVEQQPVVDVPVVPVEEAREEEPTPVEEVVEVKEVKEVEVMEVDKGKGVERQEDVPAETVEERDDDGEKDGEGDVDMVEREQEQPKEQEEDNRTAISLEERMKKLAELRTRLRDASRQNRTELINESTKAHITARDEARRERQLKLAETLRIKTEAQERGEDVERKKNWEYTIEENDEWEKKKKRKERNADFQFRDEEQQAHRRYKKDLVHLKPDLSTYNRQKEVALGLAPGTLIPGSSDVSSSSTALVTAFNPHGGSVVSYEQQRAAESLYRDANTLLYADNKPSEDAIDKVINKLNIDQDKKNKFSRKRLNEDEGDITYINERNRVFNKKIARYYDKYTAEIRASFERGTAL